jgi:hypothetical protein
MRLRENEVRARSWRLSCLETWSRVTNKVIKQLMEVVTEAKSESFASGFDSHLGELIRI